MSSSRSPNSVWGIGITTTVVKPNGLSTTEVVVTVVGELVLGLVFWCARVIAVLALQPDKLRRAVIQGVDLSARIRVKMDHFTGSGHQFHAYRLLFGVRG